MASTKSSTNEIVIDTTQIKAFSARVNMTAAEETQKYLNLAMHNSAALVRRREYREAPRGVTGGLVKGINALVTEVAAKIGPKHNIVSMSVETGSKPHMPPVDAITAWAEAKGINPWALAMSIKKKGTQANPFVQRTFKDTREEVVDEFVVATKLIVRSIAAMKGL